MRLGGTVVTGFLGEYDLEHNIALVNVMAFLDVHVIPLNNLVKLEPGCEVVALGHGRISGDVHVVMATDGILTGDSSGELELSTCKISKVHLQYDMITLICFFSPYITCVGRVSLLFCQVYEGGALFDSRGNFLGMNVSRDTEGSFFLPARMVLHWLPRFKSLRMIKFPVRSDFFRAVRYVFIYVPWLALIFHLLYRFAFLLFFWFDQIQFILRE